MRLMTRAELRKQFGNPQKQEGESFLSWAARMQIAGANSIGMKSRDFAFLIDDMRAVMGGFMSGAPPIADDTGRGEVFINRMSVRDTGESSWIAWND